VLLKYILIVCCIKHGVSVVLQVVAVKTMILPANMPGSEKREKMVGTEQSRDREGSAKCCLTF